jgi:L-alanine-DL-glutamate epimerase-like enolase superfamily enzyme
MVNSPPALSIAVERWPIAGSFTISRGAKTEAIVVVAELSADGIQGQVGVGRIRGRGECVPYARYGETPDSVVAALEAMKPRIAAGLTREALQADMPAGAARNALDCAFWDLEAKQTGRPAWQLAGLPAPVALTTAYTISLGTPENMAAAAKAVAHRPLLKIKLGGDGDPARITAVRAAVPEADLIADANEGWNPGNLAENLAACARAGVTLVEQPLPADNDGALATLARPIAVCADESVHDRKSLSALKGKYDAVNIKLDKTGGLTEALAMAEDAKKLGFEIMAGCMVATSLAMAPAILLAQRARYVDLDGPLLLARDREHGLKYDGSLLSTPSLQLWG